MKHTVLKSIFTSVACLALALSFNASAEVPDAVAAKTGASKPAKSVRPFRGQKLWEADFRADQYSMHAKAKRNGAVDSPVADFKDVSYYDYLEAPEGGSWFYTTEYDVEYNYVNEWYTEESIVGYTFTIYDSSFKKIGEIKDKITLREGETKVAHAVLDPAVSRNFFNSDANPEVMVYIAVNTPMFTNIYYNKVYSIGGEKDADGNDVSLMTVEGRCVDSFNAAKPGEPENFFYTFAGDETPDLESDYDNFVDFINSYAYPITVYGKATDDNGPVTVMEKKIFLTRIPGDTTEGIYLITKPVGGKPYFIFSYYEKPYFIDPTGMAENEEATPDNSLVIETFTIENGTPVPVTTTNIPVDAEVSSSALLYTFLSIGSVAWKNDVDMVVNGKPSAPAFIVARDVMNAATYEEVVSNYIIFGNDGKKIKTIAEDTESIVLFDSKDDEEPEVMFVKKNGNDAYTFEIAGLYSGNIHFTLDQANGGDPISASCNRMVGQDGKYKYCFEMSHYDMDESGNEYMRVAWFDDKGNLDRIDRLNMGKDVMAGAVNLFSDSLNPRLYDDDDAMEYAVLVKRTHGAATRNEFIVVDDNGEWFAHFTADDGKGDPFTFIILSGTEGNSLLMVYNDNYEYNVDIYALPFTIAAGVESIENGEGPKNVSFDGETIEADGSSIEVFTSAGVKVSAGKDSVSLASLASGIYIATVTDASGITTLKLLK